MKTNIENVYDAIKTEDTEEEHTIRFEDSINKLRIKLFVLDVYANMKIDFQEDQTEMKRAQQYAQVAEYVLLGGNHCLLNIQECRNINLSYTERKIMQECLIEHLNKRIEPILKIDWSIFKKNREITSDIIVLEEKRRENYQKIEVLTDQVCAYLKEIAELQLSSAPMKSLEVLDSEANLLHVKTSLLRAMMIKQFKFRTDHAAKAISEARLFLDAALDEIQ